MVLDRFRKKKTMKEMEDEMDLLKDEEARIDLEIKLEAKKKRVRDKRRSQSTVHKMGKEVASIAGSVGKGVVSAADAVFGGPPPPKTKRRRKKKKDDDDFFPFL